MTDDERQQGQRAYGTGRGDHETEQDAAAEQEQAERDLVRAMFGPGRADPPTETAEPTAADRVPGEGPTGEPPRPADYDERAFAARLFGTGPNSHNLVTDPDDDGPPHATTYL